ncbi:hypothetical protein [Sinorhizobium fredii]|uniref:hypothetical protein n=1 Tax=Rhizobium fredii TaxID=380 RepID=UPI003511ABA0
MSEGFCRDQFPQATVQVVSVHVFALALHDLEHCALQLLLQDTPFGFVPWQLDVQVMTL